MLLHRSTEPLPARSLRHERHKCAVPGLVEPSSGRPKHQRVAPSWSARRQLVAPRIAALSHGEANCHGVTTAGGHARSQTLFPELHALH